MIGSNCWGYLQPILSEKAYEYSIPLPGSYGREALIRPYLDSCRCRKTKTSTPRCQNCTSVRSLATYIPRKDLLCFSNADASNILKLDISGNNSMQIVHLNQILSPNTKDPVETVVVHHGDEISLHYEGLGNVSLMGNAVSDSDSGISQSLVRFRVVRVEPANDANQTFDGKGKHHDSTATADEERKTIRNRGIGYDEECKQNVRDHVESITILDNSSEYLNNDTVTDKGQKTNTNSDIKSIPQNSDSQDEVETPTQVESAPLTMPHFHAESFRSFGSNDNEHESQNQIEQNVTYSQTTPQKSNINTKRKYEEYEKINTATISDFETKVASEKHSQISLPISSLSYNQLHQLHQESYDETMESSVRNAVLSLTLALTSNASSWDSSFLKACNDKDGKKEESLQQKWMPRLLHRTQLTIQQHKDVNVHK